MKVRAWPRLGNRSANTGAYFRVLNQPSLNGLSFETPDQECDLVIYKSDSSAAAVLLVIDVPRSA